MLVSMKVERGSIRQSTQESRATTPRTAKNQQHLAWLHDSREILQEIPALDLPKSPWEKKSFDDIELINAKSVQAGAREGLDGHGARIWGRDVQSAPADGNMREMSIVRTLLLDERADSTVVVIGDLGCYVLHIGV
jgi:hypothetical protein